MSLQMPENGSKETPEVLEKLSTIERTVTSHSFKIKELERNLNAFQKTLADVENWMNELRILLNNQNIETRTMIKQMELQVKADLNEVLADHEKEEKRNWIGLEQRLNTNLSNALIDFKREQKSYWEELEKEKQQRLEARKKDRRTNNMNLFLALSTFLSVVLSYLLTKYG